MLIRDATRSCKVPLASCIMAWRRLRIFPMQGSSGSAAMAALSGTCASATLRMVLLENQTSPRLRVLPSAAT